MVRVKTIHVRLSLKRSLVTPRNTFMRKNSEECDCLSNIATLAHYRHMHVLLPVNKAVAQLLQLHCVERSVGQIGMQLVTETTQGEG